MVESDRALDPKAKDYWSYFSPNNSGPKLEATPDYIYSKHSREKLFELGISLDLMFLLREPAARLFSLFRFAKYTHHRIPSTLSFRDFVQAIRECRISDHRPLLRDGIVNGHYELVLPGWLNMAQENNAGVAVILAEEFFSRPKEVAVQLLNALGVETEGVVFSDIESCMVPQ